MNKICIKNICLLIFAISLLIITCSKTPDKPATDPDFVLEDVNGNIFKLADQLGKVVVIDFFAVDCEVCKASYPSLVDLYNEFKSDTFTTVGISIGGHHVSEVKGFQSTFHVPFPLLIDDGKHTDGVLISQTDKFLTTATPTTYMVDKKGEIRFKHTGGFIKSDFEPAIEELLAE